MDNQYLFGLNAGSESKKQHLPYFRKEIDILREGIEGTIDHIKSLVRKVATLEKRLEELFGEEQGCEVDTTTQEQVWLH